MMAFLLTSEGKNQLKSFFLKSGERHPKHWKRPVKTIRILLIAMLSLVFLVLGPILVMTLPINLTAKLLFLVAIIIIEYLLLPGIIAVAVVISSVPAKLKTWLELRQAQQKISKKHPLIIGIGGSYGKTSTKYFLYEILSKKYSVFKTPKSFNTPFSIARSINQNYHGEEIVLLEYGTYQKGEIQSLAQWFPPNHAVITGFTEQHLHLFGTIEASLQAEAELIKAIPPSGKVWYNADDSRVKEILAQVKNSDNVHAYNANNLAKYQIDEFGFLNLKLSELSPQIKTKIVGEHYLSNIAGAISVAKFLEISEAEISAGISNFVPDERFVRSYQGKSCWILDDGGTSNPEGFSKIIDLAKNFKFKTKVLITGGIVDLGDSSRSVHNQLATASENVFDSVILTTELGKDEFEQVLSKKLIINKTRIIEFLSDLPESTLLVVEGRMPGWIIPSMIKIGVKNEK
jgi:UDP-N-acetylmuramoyl-tripeptide--D-alanyl-D-alanine ligase